MLPPIVPVDLLLARRAEPGVDLVAVDVRWYLDGRSGAEAFRSGHIPGARWIDLDAVVAGPPGPAGGRHPLPDPDVFAAGLAAIGVGDRTEVVAYDDAGGMAAGRLVWMLRTLGGSAGLLDGGIGAWTGPLATGDADPVAPTTRRALPWPAHAVATIDEVADRPADTILLDARAPERYRGDVEPVDPRAGHIPGAVNVPFSGNLDASGRFLGPTELAARYAEVGIDVGDTGGNVIVSCGSGVSACHDLLAMEAAGITGARLFVGSWSAWSSDPAREAATGPTP